MADKVTILFTLKDQASKGIGGLKQGFTGLKTSLKALINPTTLVTAGIAALGATAIAQFNKFAGLETAMVNVGNLFGATRTEVNNLTDELIDLSRVTPQNLNDLSSSLFDVVSAGVPATESVKFLGDAAKLATAGVTDTKIAVDGLTSVMNAYSVEFTKADEISDKFFAAQQKGKTTIAELSSSIGNVAPIAATAGIEIDSLLSSIAAMTLQGIKTSESTTQLKAAISNVIKPSEQAKKVSQALGLEFNSQALEAKGLQGFLESVQDATGGNIDAMSMLFGSTEALNAVLALSKDEFKALKETQNAVTDSIGATDQAYKANQHTLNFQWTLIKNNANALWSIFMNVLIPTTTIVLKAFNTMFNGINVGLDFLHEKWNVFSDFFSEMFNRNTEKAIESNEKIKKSDDELLKNKEKAEKKRLQVVKNERSNEVASILQKLTEQKELEENNKAELLDIYKNWLLEQESLRQVDHEDKLFKLEEIKTANADNAEALILLDQEKFRVLKEQRIENDKAEKKALEDKLKAEKKARDQALNEILENNNTSKQDKINKLNEILVAEQYTADETVRITEEVADLQKAIKDEQVAFMLNAAATAAAGEKDIIKAGFKFIKEMLIQQIEAFITARQSELASYAIANFWNPTGWAAAAAVVGLEVLKSSARAEIMAFENGGVVPGTSFSGDNVPAMINSGELILNKPQQNNIGELLYSLAQSKPNIQGTIGSSDNSEIAKKLNRIEKILMLPGEIKLNGDSFSKAVYNRQKSMLRNGQLSAKG